MALVIRMARAGTINKPFFHIVLTEKANSRDGRYLKRLGTYQPKAKEDKDKIKVDRELIEHWVKKGAKVSETVGQLLKASAN